ncbi:MAG: endonuclease/exonuclease/phosphatase family protein [Flavobacteriia bacterium]|nr:endonuclease/exonuclease/phosphatase family protein [Flavobacteriia bacterium]
MKLIKLLFKVFFLIGLVSLLISYLAPFIHPGTIKIVPLFGLAYPIILISNLVLLVCLFFFFKKGFYILLITLLLGFNFYKKFYSFKSEKNVQIENSFKLLSYNVRLFDVYKVGFFKDFRNRDSIFSYLKSESADVICFQEFYIQDKKSKIKFPTKDTLQLLLNTPYFHSRMSFNKYFKNYFGIAMFSKYPMLTKGHVDFDDTLGNTNNYCIFSDLLYKNDTIRVYNVHFESIRFQKDDYALFNDHEITGKSKSDALNLVQKLQKSFLKRANQVKKVINHCKQSPYPVVICGDFNESPMSYNYNQFYSNYIDAFLNSGSGFGITYTGKVPAGRIDYIFHSKDLESSNFLVQKQIFSDHKALSCNIWKK